MTEHPWPEPSPANDEAFLLGQIDGDGRLGPVPMPSELFPDLAGRTVQIAEDPMFAGWYGECLRSGRERVTLLLHLFGGEREVTVDRSAVRVVEP